MNVQLQPYQIKAINAIQNAVSLGKKRIVVKMLSQKGNTVALAKTVERLNGLKSGKILVIVDKTFIKEQIENILFNSEFVQVDKNSVIVETEQRVLKHIDNKNYGCSFVLFFDIAVSKSIYNALENKTVIAFNTINSDKTCEFFKSDDVVFSYSYKDAVNDGIITPAMDSKAFEIAIELFVNRLLQQFDWVPVQINRNGKNKEWDTVVEKNGRRIWIECKTYKSQVVSPVAANSLLNSIVLRKIKQNISKEDLILLVVLSKIPSFRKDEIFMQHGIIVWDIENLVFYSKNDSELLKQLSQITCFPIDAIEGKPFGEKEILNISSEFSEHKIAEETIAEEAEKEVDKTEELILRLKECKTGKKYSDEYEDVCEDIVRTLFETNYFNKLRNQYRTNDEHFRMDLIGSLKTTQINSEYMHPFWQMLEQHYNSHFVVFEFKNSAKKIDQNLVYITEKYLFDAALRNVAIIISRKGFSKSAKFAAEGCLKEHSKLIIDVSDEDLIKMLELKSDRAADYLLDKLEDFLMGISK